MLSCYPQLNFNGRRPERDDTYDFSNTDDGFVLRHRLHGRDFAHEGTVEIPMQGLHTEDDLRANQVFYLFAVHCGTCILVYDMGNRHSFER